MKSRQRRQQLRTSTKLDPTFESTLLLWCFSYWYLMLYFAMSFKPVISFSTKYNRQQSFTNANGRSKLHLSSALSLFLHFDVIPNQRRINTFAVESRIKSIAKLYYCRPITQYHRQSNVATISSNTNHCYMSAVDDDITQEDEATLVDGGYKKTIDSVWDVPGLRKEIQRLIQRAHKKIGKIHQRLQAVQTIINDLNTNPQTTLEQLENCPDTVPIEMDLQSWQERLRILNELEVATFNLTNSKKKMITLPHDIAKLAISIRINDEPPKRPERGPPKQKGPSQSDVSPRKPYRRYYTESNVEIRVGKRAEDNDQLTTNPVHRDGSDWWMHASGCPGSHVVIRYPTSESQQQQPPNEVLLDAGSLAARYSKCFTNSFSGTISVSLTRCRDIKKPNGAKPGLVQLTGKVQTIAINMRDAQKRLERLEKTVIN